MAGHVISFYLKEQGHSVSTWTRRPFPYFSDNIVIDLSNLTKLREIVEGADYDIIVNCVGILNQSAESNKSEAVLMNSYLPHFLCELTQHMRTRIIHISTDCVFSGHTGNYGEHSLRDGETFYDRSKALGEIDNEKDLTFRTSIIGPDLKQDGIGLFNWFKKQSGDIYGYKKVIWTGVTTLVLAEAIEKAASQGLSGLYHLVNNETITKYELLGLFNLHFEQGVTIHPSEAVTLNKSLVNHRTDFKFNVLKYGSMIAAMKVWMLEHKQLYPHYF
jgi:dTDP-4-dehydrorhamnose reductase